MLPLQDEPDSGVNADQQATCAVREDPVLQDPVLQEEENIQSHSGWQVITHQSSSYSDQQEGPGHQQGNSHLGNSHSDQQDDSHSEQQGNSHSNQQDNSYPSHPKQLSNGDLNNSPSDNTHRNQQSYSTQQSNGHSDQLDKSPPDQLNDQQKSATDQHGPTLRLGLQFEPVEASKPRFNGSLHLHVESLLHQNNHSFTSTVVTISLLPNKKDTTTAFNPVWNERFTFENVTLEELGTRRVLELTMVGYDRLGNSHFAGGIRLGSHPTPADQEPPEWMDSNDKESKHWDDMLAQPGEWVESHHVLRPSMRPGKVEGLHRPASRDGSGEDRSAQVAAAMGGMVETANTSGNRLTELELQQMPPLIRVSKMLTVCLNSQR